MQLLRSCAGLAGGWSYCSPEHEQMSQQPCNTHRHMQCLYYIYITFSRRFYPKRLTYVRLTMYTHFTFTLMAHCTSGAIRGSVPCSWTLRQGIELATFYWTAAPLYTTANTGTSVITTNKHTRQACTRAYTH